MRDSTEVSEATKALEVDRRQFETAVAKLLAAPPTSTAAISASLRLNSRLRPLTKALLEK